MISRIPLIALVLMLGGCDIEALLADPRVAQKEADSKAIGGACRYGLRSIEDCYALNPKASKAAIFSGWKDMDQYMRDNKVEGIPAKIEPVITPPSTNQPPDEAGHEAPVTTEEKPKPDAKVETPPDSKAEKKPPKKAQKPAQAPQKTETAPEPASATTH